MWAPRNTFQNVIGKTRDFVQLGEEIYVTLSTDSARKDEYILHPRRDMLFEVSVLSVKTVVKSDFLVVFR